MPPRAPSDSPLVSLDHRNEEHPCGRKNGTSFKEEEGVLVRSTAARMEQQERDGSLSGSRSEHSSHTTSPRRMFRRNSAPTPKTFRLEISRNTIHEIPHLDDMTLDELNSIWFDDTEYKKIKANIRTTIMKMEAGHDFDDVQDTCRGLEDRTQQGSWTKYEDVAKVCNAVLDEQDRQWDSDIDDHDEIARIYSIHSSKFVCTALARGMQDEQEASRLWTQEQLDQNSQHSATVHMMDMTPCRTAVDSPPKQPANLAKRTSLAAAEGGSPAARGMDGGIMMTSAASPGRVTRGMDDALALSPAGRGMDGGILVSPNLARAGAPGGGGAGRGMDGGITMMMSPTLNSSFRGMEDRAPQNPSLRRSSHGGDARGTDSSPGQVLPPQPPPRPAASPPLNSAASKKNFANRSVDQPPASPMRSGGPPALPQPNQPVVRDSLTLVHMHRHHHPQQPQRPGEAVAAGGDGLAGARGRGTESTPMIAWPPESHTGKS